MNRRQTLATLQVSNIDHAGLWLDKFLGTNADTDKAKTLLVREVANVPEPDAYRHFYAAWVASLKQRGAETRTASVDGRMIVGLGAESVLETSVCLHRTYGVPYIPGSALKGITAAYARQQLVGWDKPEDDSALTNYSVVFGTTARAGTITFYDALYIPRSAQQPLLVDVMTPHHSTYYVAQAQSPSDFDAPVPVQFLSANGSYLTALGGDEGWVNYVFKIMTLALAEHGVGAKTSSGYGRMRIEEPPPDPEQALATALLADIDRLRPNDVATRLDPLFKRWQQLPSTFKRDVAEALLKKVRDAGREKASQDKPWYKELQQTVNP